MLSKSRRNEHLARADLTAEAANEGRIHFAFAPLQFRFNNEFVDKEL